MSHGRVSLPFVSESTCTAIKPAGVATSRSSQNRLRCASHRAVPSASTRPLPSRSVRPVRPARPVPSTRRGRPVPTARPVRPSPTCFCLCRTSSLRMRRIVPCRVSCRDLGNRKGALSYATALGIRCVCRECSNPGGMLCHVHRYHRCQSTGDDGKEQCEEAGPIQGDEDEVIKAKGMKAIYFAFAVSASSAAIQVACTHVGARTSRTCWLSCLKQFFKSHWAAVQSASASRTSAAARAAMPRRRASHLCYGATAPPSLNHDNYSVRIRRCS